MKIFISYRRAEDNKSYIVGIIHEKLAKAFGEEGVFRDTYDIASGADWRNVLEQEINSCKVMLVIMGPDWTNLAYPNGEKRLFDPQDVTRREVETGLRRSKEENITIIPILVTGAKRPEEKELPESLRPLLNKQVISIRNFPDFDHDMEKLITDIRRSQGYGEDDISTEYFEPKTIYIAEGSFWMGSIPNNETPQYETPEHEVILPAYRIGKYPVTNAQFEEFVSQTRSLVSPIMGWEGQKVPQGFEDYPVTGVTWLEARLYCDWLTAVTGRKYSLPNEAQWEKACRGADKRLYPWGNEFDDKRCNHGHANVAPVNAYREQSIFGCFDLVGNVRQWTSTLWGEKRAAPNPRYAYPWRNDGRNSMDTNKHIRRVIRGSAMKDSIAKHRCFARSCQLPDDRGFPGARTSFRVVLLAE